MILTVSPSDIIWAALCAFCLVVYLILYVLSKKNKR